MKNVKFAFKQTLPILFTYVFLGIAFGMMMNDAGYGVGLSAASGIFVYAGSLQIAMVPMMAAHTPLLTLALMSFFINARHIFYGIAFIEKYRKTGWRYPYLVFALTDETYSVLISLDPEQDGQDYDFAQAAFWISLLNQLYWVIGCILGTCAGRFLPLDLKGIEFSGTAFFLVVVVNQWQQYKSKAPFILAAACAAVFFILFGPDYFLIPALLSCLVILLCMYKPVSGKEVIRHE